MSIRNRTATTCIYGTSFIPTFPHVGGFFSRIEIPLENHDRIHARERISSRFGFLCVCSTATSLSRASRPSSAPPRDLFHRSSARNPSDGIPPRRSAIRAAGGRHRAPERCHARRGGVPPRLPRFRAAAARPARAALRVPPLPPPPTLRKSSRAPSLSSLSMSSPRRSPLSMFRALSSTRTVVHPPCRPHALRPAPPLSNGPPVLLWQQEEVGRWEEAQEQSADAATTMLLAALRRLKSEPQRQRLERGLPGCILYADDRRLSASSLRAAGSDSFEAHGREFPYWLATKLINRAYAQRHGYRFVEMGEADKEPGRHPSWFKVRFLQRQLSCCCEWAFSLDSDAYFRMDNHRLSVQSWVDRLTLL
ncbi:unnamed protein product, partial [Closterium sp. Naga37s-1]